MKTPKPSSAQGGERIAKVMARAGLCSRREAEAWILAGRVSLDDRVLDTPAVVVRPGDRVLVDGRPLPGRERTRLFLYHKPKGLVTTEHDPQERPTVFAALPPELPRLVTVGRLDVNTEGLLLLTNDGGLARVLSLPATGWLRRYRVRAFGEVTAERLAALGPGLELDGVRYGPIEATLDRTQRSNVWLTLALREGKNREVKRVLDHLGLAVNRLIRVSFGPFQLGELRPGALREVERRVLRDQLGAKLAKEGAVDLDAPVREALQAAPAPTKTRSAKPGNSSRPRGRARSAAADALPGAITTEGDASPRAARQRTGQRTGKKSRAHVETGSRLFGRPRRAKPSRSKTGRPR